MSTVDPTLKSDILQHGTYVIKVLTFTLILFHLNQSTQKKPMQSLKQLHKPFKLYIYIYICI